MPRLRRDDVIMWEFPGEESDNSTHSSSKKRSCNDCYISSGLKLPDPWIIYYHSVSNSFLLAMQFLSVMWWIWETHSDNLNLHSMLSGGVDLSLSAILCDQYVPTV